MEQGTKFYGSTEAEQVFGHRRFREASPTELMPEFSLGDEEEIVRRQEGDVQRHFKEKR